MSLNGFTKQDLLNLLIQNELRFNSNNDLSQYILQEEASSGDFIVIHRTSAGDSIIFRLTSAGVLTLAGGLILNKIQDADNTTYVDTTEQAENIIFRASNAQKMRIDSLAVYNSTGIYSLSNTLTSAVLDSGGSNIRLTPNSTYTGIFEIGNTGNLIYDTNKFFINQSTGNVGIGKTNPGSKLEIDDNTTAVNSISLRVMNSGSNPGGSSKMIVGRNTSAGGAGIGDNYGFIRHEYVGDSSLSNSLILGSGFVDIMKILRDPVLGTGGIVNITGDLNVSDILTVNNQLNLTNSTLKILNDSNNMAFYSGGTEKMRIESGGFVGIGTNNPNYELDVSGTTYALLTLSEQVGIGTISPNTNLEIQSTSPEIRLTDGRADYGSAANVDLGKISWYSRDSSLTNDYDPIAQIAVVSDNSTVAPDGKIIFKTGNNGVLSDKLAIDVNGNLGIGTNNPVVKLHINQEDSNEIFTKYTNTTTGTTSTDGFSVGIDGNEFSVLRNYENTGMIFYTNNTERMRIESDGDVGIGTNNPSQSLDVNGNIVASGWIRGTTAGQLLNSVYIDNQTLVTSTINSTSFQTVISYSYTPVSSSSKIRVQYDGRYTIAGNGADNFESAVNIGGTQVQAKEQLFVNNSGGGTRSGTLFPITGVYTNTSTTAKTILIQARRITSDDNINIGGDNTLIITEIAN